MSFSTEDEMKIEDFKSPFKTKYSSLDNKMLIANTTEDNIIKIRSIFFNKQTHNWQLGDTQTSEIKLNPLNYFTNAKYDMESYMFTDRNNYLILSTQSCIKYINIYNQDIISEFQLNMAAVDQISLKNLEIKTVPFTDNLIILYEHYKFIYIRFDNNYYSISSIERVYDNCLIAEWKLTGSLLCFLLESSQQMNILLVNSLTVDNEKSLIEMKEIFKEKFDLDTIKSYCLTPNLDYLVVYKLNRVLSLYRIKDCCCIANVPMFSDVVCMLATPQMIVMAIAERRIVSYIIADPQSTDYSYKLQNMESRFYLGKISIK